MKIGLILPQGFFKECQGWPADRAWQRMLTIARLAEALGFDSVWTGEHVLARWGGTSPAFDCFTIGAALAKQYRPNKHQSRCSRSPSKRGVPPAVSAGSPQAIKVSSRLLHQRRESKVRNSVKGARHLTKHSKEATRLVVPGGGDAGPLELPLLVVRGRAPGPHVVVLGGVHGDEYEGVVAAAAVWRDLDPTELRGRVSIVAVANPPAFGAGARTSPIDGANLARTFPGSPIGSVTERIAHHLSASLIRQADLLIDLHSAGQHYAMPLLCGSYAAADDLGRRCRATALAFGAPVYWAHPDVSPGRSLSVALDAGVPCIYAECGGGGRVRPADVQAYRLGVRRVLAHIGALPPMDPAPAPGLRLRSTGDVDTALSVRHAGILVEHTSILAPVQPGDVLGTVLDEHGEVLETLRSPAQGFVVMARRTARVRPDDGAYLIALRDDSKEELR